MKQHKNTDRRSFLKGMALGGGAFILPRFSIGKPGPSANGKVNLAYVGVGGIAAGVMRLGGQDNNVAICDVDMVKAARNWEPFTGAKFRDYRVMMDKMGDQIDAVVVSTPDHTHFTAAMEAIERGKHVFVQKPLAHDIWQCRTLSKAVAEKKLISNMGNQGHAGEGIRLLKEWIDAGLLGEGTESHCWWKPHPDYGKPAEATPRYRRSESFPPPPSKAPDTLDWDLWLGSAAERPFSDYYHPGWSGWYDFGNGAITDLGTHSLDAAYWALDLGPPKSISAEVVNKMPAMKGLCPPDQSIATMVFPPRGSRSGEFVMKWYDGGLKPDHLFEKYRALGINLPENGVLLVGSRHDCLLNTWCGSPRLLMPDAEWDEFRRGSLPEKTIPRVKGGPHREWLDAIKGGPVPGSNFAVSGPYTEVALLGALATRTEEEIIWDHEKMRITNKPELNRYVKQPVRPGWESGENYWKG